MWGGLPVVEWFFVNGIGGEPWNHNLEVLLPRTAHRLSAEAQVPDNQGWRPIHFAAAGGNPEVVSWLVHKGTSVKVTRSASGTSNHSSLTAAVCFTDKG